SAMQRAPQGGVATNGTVTVTGRVTNSAGVPIANARVYVPGTGEATRTDANGNYTLTGVPGGPQEVVVRSYGYVPVRTDAKFSTKPGDAERNRVNITLATPSEAVAQANQRVSDSLELARAGFLHREAAIKGAYFITPEEIRDANATRVSDILRTIPVIVETAGPYGTALRGAQGCLLTYVDGLPWRSMFPGDLDTDIPVRDVVAAEVYPPGMAPPSPFLRGIARPNCTTVGIWTRSSLG
ncbi:MAG TPA: carboxypeptidase regulatory-like domain-containing protein, partial [Gemmatimonadaceae bacterium]|nr:carboxypeptidase regulatory-like domain-containing protein [Gemmatimonadaceae bacterium]